MGLLHKLISSVEADEECVDLLYQAQYLDDGALAGNRPAVLQAVHIIEEMGLLWACISTLPNPPAVKCSLLPNLDILGVPVGDYLHCSRFIANKCAESKKLLSSLVDVAGGGLHIAAHVWRFLQDGSPD